MPRRYLILILSLMLTALPAAAADRDDGKRELERIRKEMADKKQKLRRAGRRERSALSELERIDRDILAGGAELAEQQRRLADAEAALAEMEAGRANISREMDRIQPLFAARLRTLYKAQRSGGYALAVLSSDDAAAALRRARALAVIARRDQRLTEEYRETLGRFESVRDELRDRQAAIRGYAREVEARRRQLEEQRTRKQKLLALLREEKSSYEETLQELEESSASLWAMVREAERVRTAAPRTPADRGALAGNRRDALPWPLEGEVLTRFGTQRHPRFGTVVFRRGIEIRAREGEEVRTVAAGQVAFADWYKGYGRLVIVDHGAGFYTLYGHLSVLGVAAGEQVARGRMVGRAGDTGSLSGPRLYFELRRDGEAQDPLLWLAKR